MQVHNLKRNTPQKKSRQIGRGGKRGKTSGRGTKGQKARAGRKLRPELRDIIRRIPKRRGFGKNRGRTFNPRKDSISVINIGVIDRKLIGTDVSPRILLEQKIIRVKRGTKIVVKILGNGSISKKLKINDCVVSDKAKKKIETAGGTISA